MDATFEVDGKTYENKPICMVHIFWDGDTENYEMGNYEVLDERSETTLSKCVVMSMYRTEEAAEAGYERWLAVLRKDYEDTVAVYRKLAATGIEKLYPSVMQKFYEVSHLDEETVKIVEEGRFEELYPKAHKVAKTDLKSLNKIMHSFTNPQYAEDRISK